MKKPLSPKDRRKAHDAVWVSMLTDSYRGAESLVTFKRVLIKLGPSRKTAIHFIWTEKDFEDAKANIS